MNAPRAAYLSWGRVHRYAHYAVAPGFFDNAGRSMASILAKGESMLPYGLGRSYGDSCLNDGHGLLDTHLLDRFIAFDPATGELECEAGVSLADILTLLISRPAHEPRWFLPVTPGTKFVTVGGAIANDVHGKSHHSTGCFGAHVRSLRLLRSDGNTFDCSLEQNVDLFRATLGGLGLTGLILSARVALTRVAGFWLETEDFRYDDLDAFFRLSEESHAEWQYTVAWVDCLARGRSLGRGVFSRARHCARLPPGVGAPLAAKPRFAMRFDAPGFLLNRHSVSAFNAFRWRRFARQSKRELRAFDQVLYPLDAIAEWNRLRPARFFSVSMRHSRGVRPERRPVVAGALLNPALTEGDRIASHVGRLRYAQPVCPPGFLENVPPMAGIIAGLQIADTSVYYPEDRGISESVRIAAVLVAGVR